MELAEKVKLRRVELGLSQEDLARKMGYKSRTSINKIEMGRPVTQKIIVRLADALDVSVPYLMGIKMEPEDLGAMAADVLLDPELLQLVNDYKQLDEADRYTLRLVAASMLAKKKD